MYLYICTQVNLGYVRECELFLTFYCKVLFRFDEITMINNFVIDFK